MKVKKFEINEIFDSRGASTLAVAITNEKNASFRSSLPSGRSRGSREACVLDFKNASDAGHLRRLRVIEGKNFGSQRSFDEFLIRLDGTKNKRNIGGNVMLGLSLSFARGMAAERDGELWESLQGEFFDRSARKNWKPVIFSNLINGGEHAKNNLDIQEYMVLVRTDAGMRKAVHELISFYETLGKELARKKHVSAMPIGDEGGYAIDFKNNEEPLTILAGLIRRRGLSKSFSLGMDAAANSFSSRGGYRFGGKTMTTEKLAAIYGSYFGKIPLLFSVEDPFSENDREGFALLMGKLRGKIIVGDDLTVTNRDAIEECSSEGLINGVIIKPNQAGTVTEAAEALKAASRRKVKTIVSHRSGETDDVFIIHLAKAAAAYGVKIGAPARERIFKFNELLRISQ